MRASRRIALLLAFALIGLWSVSWANGQINQPGKPAVGTEPDPLTQPDLQAEGQATVPTHTFSLKGRRFYQIIAEGDGFRPIVRSAEPRREVLPGETQGRNQFSGYFLPTKDGEFRFAVTPELTGALPEGGKLAYKLRLKETDQLTILAAPSITDERNPKTNLPQKVFIIPLKAKQKYTIELIGLDPCDPYLFIEDIDEQPLAENDDAKIGDTPLQQLNSRLVFTPEETGNYRIIATTLGAIKQLPPIGKMKLVISLGEKKGDVVEKKKEKPGEPVGKGGILLQQKGELTAKDPLYTTGSPYKLYKLKLKAKTNYIIEMKAIGKFDPYLVIEDEDMDILAEDDDSGGNLDALIKFTPRKDGEYRIIATSFMGATGQYELIVREATAGPTNPKRPNPDQD
jgi:hypothetical protein